MGYGTRLIILDYDLTLVDNIYDFYLSVASVFRERTGLYLDYNKFYSLFLDDKLYSFITYELGFKEDFWRDMRKLICKSHSLKPAEGLYDFLLFTKNMGLKVAVVTGRECYSDQIRLDLEKIQLSEYIDGVYTMFDLYINGGTEDFLFDKSWLIKFVCKKHGVEPPEAIYVGDYKLDYQSCLKAGCRFLGLTWIPERAKLLKNNGVSRVANNFREAILHVADMMKT